NRPANQAMDRTAILPHRVDVASLASQMEQPGSSTEAEEITGENSPSVQQSRRSWEAPVTSDVMSGPEGTCINWGDQVVTRSISQIFHPGWRFAWSRGFAQCL